MASEIERILSAVRILQDFSPLPPGEFWRLQLRALAYAGLERILTLPPAFFLQDGCICVVASGLPEPLQWR